MKIVNRYLIKNFSGPFVLTFFVALFVLLMQFLWKWVDQLVGKGLEISILLKLMFYASITLASMAFPLAVLLASLMTFGNMGERYEIVAFKSAGISVRQLMRPLAFVAVIIALIAFEFSNHIIPNANVKLKMLLYEIQEQKPALSIDEGVFYTGIDNYAIRIGKKHPGSEEIEDILIYDHSSHRGNTMVTYAKRGKMEVTPDKHYLLFTLYDGSYWDEGGVQAAPGAPRKKLPLTRAAFSKEYMRLDMSDFQMADADESMYHSHSTTMSSKDLNLKIDTLKREIRMLAGQASDVFFSHLYYFNTYVRGCSAFDTLSHACRCGLADETAERQAGVFRYAENAARNFVYSVRFAYQDMLYRTKYLWSFQIELFRKVTLSLACVLFFFIGAPLGSIIRKGGIGVPLVITVVFFTLYFALSIMGEKIAKNSLLPIWFGMGLSSFVLIPVDIFMTYQATADSAALSPDTYIKWIQKVRNLKLFSKKNHEDTAVMP